MIAIIVCAVLVVALIIYIIVENFVFSTTKYEIKVDGLNEQLAILQISDLHNKSFGKNNESLCKEVAKQNPDIIVFTGDTIDGEDTTSSLSLIKQCTKVAPTFIIRGNHEAHLSKAVLDNYESKCKEEGAVILAEESTYLPIGGGINLIGLSDPNNYTTQNRDSAISAKIAEIINTIDNDKPIIAVSHRPEYLSTYANYPIDVVLVGHAHGGQWRLFGQGAYATGQGIFPKLTSGVHKENNTSMVISRGLGNGKPIPRIFNMPELVKVVLKP